MGKNVQSLNGILKLIAFLFLVPVVIAVIQAFGVELSNLIDSQYEAFVLGVISLIIIHLFVFTPLTVYQSGQKVFAEVFGLFPRVGNIIALIVPLLASLLLIILYLCSNIFKISGFEKQFLFFVGFFLAFHIVLTANDMYDEDTTFLKPNYFFGISLVVIFNILIVSSLLELNFDRFSFLEFLNICLENTKNNVMNFPGNILSVIE